VDIGFNPFPSVGLDRVSLQIRVQSVKYSGEALDSTQVGWLDLYYQMGDANIREGSQTLGHLLGSTYYGFLLRFRRLTRTKYMDQCTGS